MSVEDTAAVPGSEVSPRGRVCLVEDSKTAAFTLVQMLQKLGFEVVHHLEALAAFESLQNDDFDLLITDLSLQPGLEQGDDLIRAVRASDDEELNRLPILVLTGDQESATLSRVFEVGANDYLAKSATEQELNARIGNLVRIKRTYDNLAHRTHEQQGLICLVEDSRTYAYAMQKLLKEHDYSVEHFTNAKDALEAIPCKPFDLILTDLRLAGDMDGDVLTFSVRQMQDPLKQKLPVLVVTSDQEEKTLLSLFEAGANDYLIKPVRNPELLARIRNLVQIKRDRDEMARQQAAAEVERNNGEQLVAPQVEPVQLNQKPRRKLREAPQVQAEIMDLPVPGVSWGERWGVWVTTHPWLALLMTLVLFALSAVGVGNLGFVDDYRVYFSEENPDLRAFDALEQTYSKNYNALFVVAPVSQNVFDTQVLTAVEWLTQAAWKMPYSTRVDSLSNFQHSWAEGDELIVKDLAAGAARMTGKDVDRVKKIALSEPLLVNRLISPNGHVTGINVSLQLPGRDTNESHVATEYGRGLIKEFNAKFPGMPVYLSGMVVQDDAFMLATLGDMETLYPAMLLFVILAAGVLLRSFAGVLAISIVIAGAAFSALGVFGWFGYALSTPSAAAPTIILTVAVGDSIHLLTAFFHQLRQGSSKRDALVEAVRLNMMPVFLTSLTNAIGFLSMNFGDAPPLRDLGNIVALGVAYAWVFSMALLPALMMLVPFKPPVVGAIRKSWLDGWLERWGDFTIRRQKPVLRSAFILIPIICAGVLLINLDDNFIEYLDDRYQARVDTDFVRANLSGMDSIEYSLRSAEAGGINEPKYLEQVESFANWYRKQEGVVHVSAITDIVKRLNVNMHDNDSFFSRVPESRELVAQYMLLYKMSLPQGLDLNNQINLDESSSRFSVTLGNISNAQLLDLELRAYQWLQDNAPPAMVAHGASPSLMFARIADRNVNNMVSGNLLSLLLVSTIMLIALRSFFLGGISLVPNLFPALLAFGVWGYLVGEVGLAAAVVFSMTQGIVVDDSVHFMAHYADGRRRGMFPEKAIKDTFLHVGPSMMFTSIILVGGFLILATSGFRVNSTMGILTAMTFVLAWVLDMLLLAPLLAWLDGARCRRAAQRSIGA